MKWNSTGPDTWFGLRAADLCGFLHPVPKVGRVLSSEGWATLSTAFCLMLPRALYEEMLAQARAELPNECCGILAGKIVASAESGDSPRGQVVRRFALVNDAHSPVEYLSEPRSMFDADKAMKREGLDMLAVYHSHPTSDPVPSRKDRERSYHPDVMNLIISLKTADAVMRGWWLTAEDYREGEWRVVES
jgi:proteasome lid subunit RPN8/RPN11